MSPGPYTGKPCEDAKLSDGVKNVEIAEDRAEYDIDEAEPVAIEPWSLPKLRVQPKELCAERRDFCFQRFIVRRRVEPCNVVQDSRSKFNPGTVAGAIESVVRMKRVGLCILKIFEDNRRFENRRPVHNQDRRLAQRRYGKKPVGLVRKIDVSSLERDTFLSERDRRALHIWAERMANEVEAHVVSPAICTLPGAKEGLRAKRPSPRSPCTMASSVR